MYKKDKVKVGKEKSRGFSKDIYQHSTLLVGVKIGLLFVAAIAFIKIQNNHCLGCTESSLVLQSMLMNSISKGIFKHNRFVRSCELRFDGDLFFWEPFLHFWLINLGTHYMCIRIHIYCKVSNMIIKWMQGNMMPILRIVF